MASHSRHRKPRSPLVSQTATGATLAAVATVTVMAQPGSATPRPAQPSLQDVQKRVDSLYHQAELSTERYNGAKEKTAKLQKQVNALQNTVAAKTAAMQASQDRIGRLAAAQYRAGGVSEVVQLALSGDPEKYLSGADLIRQVGQTQKDDLAAIARARKSIDKDRRTATGKLGQLSASQRKLADEKHAVESKLREAQNLLNHLTAEQKAKLAAEQRAKEAAARKKAAEIAEREAERRAAAEAARKKAAAAAAAKTKASSSTSSGSSSSSSGSTSTGSSSSGSSSGSTSTSTSKAAKAIAFARAQIGKPYVWGATGPDGYDCSGLTQAAYKAAGVTLPRTTWDQVKIGTRVSTDDLQPGDLIFFYSDISHVGLYIGGGEMIHAPHTGADVKIAPISEMPIYGAVRVG